MEVDDRSSSLSTLDRISRHFVRAVWHGRVRRLRLHLVYRDPHEGAPVVEEAHQTSFPVLNAAYNPSSTDRVMVMSGSRSGAARERDIGALVEAATDLFAERGPAATSLRDVAARAGVNYGLIHQYIGTKDDLLRLVVERVSVETAERVAAGTSVADLVSDVVHGGASPYLRML